MAELLSIIQDKNTGICTVRKEPRPMLEYLIQKEGRGILGEDINGDGIIIPGKYITHYKDMPFKDMMSGTESIRKRFVQTFISTLLPAPTVVPEGYHVITIGSYKHNGEPIEIVVDMATVPPVLLPPAPPPAPMSEPVVMVSMIAPVVAPVAPPEPEEYNGPPMPPPVPSA